jgi:hypothetical protein
LRTRIKRACYNYRKYGHLIANCPYENEEEDEGKKKKEKSYKKDKKFTKKKYYGEAHIEQE